MAVHPSDRFGLIARRHACHRDDWADLTNNPDPTGVICATDGCSDDEGPFCEGCGSCEADCDCTPSDCDCDVCEERRRNCG